MQLLLKSSLSQQLITKFWNPALMLETTCSSHESVHQCKSTNHLSLAHLASTIFIFGENDVSLNIDNITPFYFLFWLE